ncbi:YraN family protein [Leptospira gomenensis]|uniref:UPF0102 protein EHQ17_07610 n=1 Tax=Leptospira gomenensis TaxID=2484974 RepID=A0A5F1YC69_9LEPT|nr:YraN family protein [Leptospira gomenensis]TGK35028.1 YraN family protein [Leptospira gomenensis]TGK35294.1 YraN family protein [Leptospira gomenensis]TGK51779.1 YraN family protein [Leptospira gomenensis]TGK58374.1 YraN family protein [Leptospira gomenensis]
MVDFRKRKGQEGESIACEFLISLGHSILERNYRYGRIEIDIISTKGEILYFTEVKHWKEFPGFDPILSLTTSKQNRMRTAASGYLIERLSLRNHFVSFALVSINSEKGCEYYPDLF